jgi:hypothetical protein
VPDFFHVLFIRKAVMEHPISSRWGRIRPFFLLAGVAFAIAVLVGSSRAESKEDWPVLRKKFAAAYSSPREGRRVKALGYLARAGNLEATKLLLTLLADPSQEVYREIIKILSGLKDEESVAWLLDKGMKTRGKNALLIKTTILQALARLGTEEKALDILSKSLKERRWQLRSVAIESLGKRRSRGGIELLIRLLKKEKRLRLRWEAFRSVRQITGRRFDDADALESWWEKNKKTFQVPGAPKTRVKPKGPGKPAEKGVKERKWDGRGPFGLPLDTNAVVFILDISGSMEKAGRLDESVAQLEEAIEALEKESHFNVIYYSEAAIPMKKGGLIGASRRNRLQAINFLGGLKPKGYTNTIAALKMALASGDLDTIYLLSDGLPSTPKDDKWEEKVKLARELLEYITPLNRALRIRIHTVTVAYNPGDEEKGAAKFLKRLADDNYGIFRWVDK